MKDINGYTEIFGLLGNPVEHTCSPFIHQLFYEELDYNGSYNPYLVPKGKLEDAIAGMKALSIKGLNVTVPYKVEVMHFLDDIDDMAKKIGAINTIVPMGENRLKGYNTDWIGLKMACDSESIPIKDRDIVIIGGGGAARSAAFMCMYYEAKSLTILNRTVEKAKTIKEQVHVYSGKRLPIAVGSLGDIDLVKKGSTAIQTTVVGMYPKSEVSPITEDSFFSKVDFIVDIIYNPKETEFMKRGISHGVTVMNGLGMLYYQALKAFELWTGRTLSKEQSLRGLERLVDRVYEHT